MGDHASTVAAITRDLHLIADQARWAHTHGWWAEGHGLDSEHGTDLSRTEHQRQDGPTYDIEIGSHPARVAYQHAATTVARCDVLLAAVIVDQGGRAQPPLLPLNTYSPPTVLAQVAGHAAWRATHTEPHRRLDAVRKSLDRTVRGLGKALDHGPIPYTSHQQSPCRTCTIRDRAPRKAECDTCATWRARHGGATRPADLDLGPLNEARAAQARRLARGEGWGAA